MTMIVQSGTGVSHVSDSEPQGQSAFFGKCLFYFCSSNCERRNCNSNGTNKQVRLFGEYILLQRQLCQKFDLIWPIEEKISAKNPFPSEKQESKQSTWHSLSVRIIKAVRCKMNNMFPMLIYSAQRMYPWIKSSYELHKEGRPCKRLKALYVGV